MTKIALITGGSRGLGKEMALALAHKGNDVILTYHESKDGALQVVADIEALGRKAVALHLNVADIPSLDGFLATVSDTLRTHWNTERFDFLINNAGIGRTILIDQVTEEIFDNMLNIHYKSVYFLTQKSLRMMNDGGAVVNISTGTTRFCVHGYSAYSPFKAAVENFTKYVAKEYGPRGIRCNVVAPGPIETDFNNAAIRNNPQVKAMMAANTALQRVGQADDVGTVVAFLCSEDARWVNGQRIEVSGGISL